MERCNYNVKYTDFIRSLRYKAVSAGTEIQCSHGGALQAIMHMMAQKDIKQNRLSWFPSDISISKDSDTAFFVGCNPHFDVVFKDIEAKTLEGTIGALRLLNKAQIPFTLMPNERCCGHDLLSVGDVDGFLSLARANLNEFKKQGIKNIITSCPEGYYTFGVDYPRFLDDWDIKVTHTTEVIAPLIRDGQLSLDKLEKKVTYHDPCKLGRYSRIFDQPRDILTSIEGLELLEMAESREKALCCGASPWAYCGSTNKQIQRDRLAQAAATGADVLVTACPKCLIHLKCAQKNAENNNVCQIEIKDIFEIAAQSLSSQEVG